MNILKRFAKYILRTELQTLQTKTDNYKAASEEFYKLYQQELNISKDLKDHFTKKTVPINIYKTLEDKQVLVNDLRMLKSIYVTLKGTEYLNIKTCKEYAKQLDEYAKQGLDQKLEAIHIKQQNQLTVDKLTAQVKSLETIISKLKDIID